MIITHFGHAAVLVETESRARVLIDPGTYSTGFEDLRDIDVIAATHAHADHLDPARIGALRESNPSAVVVATADGHAATGVTRDGDLTVADNSAVNVGGIHLEPTGAQHATVHRDLPPMANTGYIVDGQVWHPGDSFDAEPRGVRVLLLPVGGPWMKISEAIDFARAVAPQYIVPIHQAGLAEIHRELHYELVRKLVPAEFIVLEQGVKHAF